MLPRETHTQNWALININMEIIVALVDMASSKTLAAMVPLRLATAFAKEDTIKLTDMPLLKAKEPVLRA